MDRHALKLGATVYGAMWSDSDGRPRTCRFELTAVTEGETPAFIITPAGTPDSLRDYHSVGIGLDAFDSGFYSGGYFVALGLTELEAVQHYQAMLARFGNDLRRKVDEVAMKIESTGRLAAELAATTGENQNEHETQ